MINNLYSVTIIFMTPEQVLAILSLLLSFNVPQNVVDKVADDLNYPIQTVYLSSTVIHSDGTKGKTKDEVFRGILSAPRQSLPIKSF